MAFFFLRGEGDVMKSSVTINVRAMLVYSLIRSVLGGGVFAFM